MTVPLSVVFRRMGAGADVRESVGCWTVVTTYYVWLVVRYTGLLLIALIASSALVFLGACLAWGTLGAAVFSLYVSVRVVVGDKVPYLGDLVTVLLLYAGLFLVYLIVFLAVRRLWRVYEAHGKEGFFILCGVAGAVGLMGLGVYTYITGGPAVG